jgi:hypothetical protein
VQEAEVMRFQRLVQQQIRPRSRVDAVLLSLAALLLGVAGSQPAAADWLSSFRNPSAKVMALDAAGARLKIFAATAAGPALAATVSQEGHWTFVNKLGERFTAASAEELKRVVGTLIHEPAATSAPVPSGRLIVLLTEDAIFDNRTWLKDLPKGADLRVVVNDDVWRLHQRGELARGQSPAAPLLFAEIRPNLLVAATDRAQFDEAVWQLNQPLKAANIRVLSLEPGGPPTLAGTPKLDPVTRRPLIDRLDPLRATDAMKALRGQTALVVGRIDGKLLFVRGSSGPEQSVILADLVQAAEAADVNLVLLQSASSRQPGVRNWLWQKAEVAGLDDALARAQLSDLLAVLGTGERPLAIMPTAGMPAAGTAPSSPPITPPIPGRIVLTAVPAVAPNMLETVLPVGRAAELISGAIDDVMSGLTGKVTVTQAQLHLQSRQRTLDLQGRLLSNVPTGWIEAYLGALVLGLLGWRLTSRWWQRLWPRETRGDYAGTLGFRAAQAARALLMVAVFLPVAGLLALPALLVTWLKPPRPATAAYPSSGASL